MSKMTEKVALEIAKRFLKGTEGFDVKTLENYKDIFVFLAFPEGVTGEINIGLPIYVLIDKLGKARYATYEENYEILKRANPTEERLRRKRMKRLKRLRRKGMMRKRTRGI